MTESKLLEGDKDEWFYQSLERYSNLYMFELEFPVDAIEIIDDTSISLSGIQNYSKKCEILQLSIPPKLLPKDMEEGLCKDRDFKIISGGYAASRILQIKAVKSAKNFVAAVQLGTSGVTLFELGDDNHAVITERSILNLADNICTGVIDTFGNRILAAGTEGTHLYEWKLDEERNTSESVLKYALPSNNGRITKLKFWDENNLASCTEKGEISLFDVRKKEFALSLSASTPQSVINASGSMPSLLFSFDVQPNLNTVGVVDSCGGYESFDIRNIKEERTRTILPCCSNSPAVFSGKFNMEYEQSPKDEGNLKFIVTGMKEDVVQIYEDKNHGAGIAPIFAHDGHSKAVTHALWHPLSEGLLFSTSIDAVLHAWQYNPSAVAGLNPTLGI